MSSAAIFRRLLTARWLGALLAAVVFAVTAWFLGQWQWGRHVAKVERNARLDAHFRAEPVMVSTVLTKAPLPLSQQWTHVTATGAYLPQDQLYVRNRPNDGVYGYEVLVPLQLTSGSVVLVNRGWVQNSPQGADVLPPVPPAPSGEVTVTGWVLPGEPSLGRRLPSGQLASINVTEASEATGLDLLGGYVLLDHERTASGATPPRPAPLAPPDRSLGPHQAYAWNWWLVMPAGFLLIWLGIRRELREEHPHLVKAKKHRIWDDEDE